MDLEQGSQDQASNQALLQDYDTTPENTQILYKLLLQHLENKDFNSFKKIVEQSLKKQPSILNLNYIYPNHSGDTCLDIACRNGLEKFVKFLLCKGAEPNIVNEMHNRAPIHFATENGNVDTLKALLNERTINLDLEAGQQTALHIAVNKNNEICAELLLEAGASADIPNSKGVTALHLAAMKKQRSIVQLILKKRLPHLDLDTYKDYENRTTREVIKQNLPDIVLPEKEYHRKVNVHDLKYYLNANDEIRFQQSLEAMKTIDHHVIEDLLEMAVQYDYNWAVKAILHHVQTYERYDINVEKAAQAAIQKGHYEVLKTLFFIIRPEAVNDLVLNACLELGMPGKKGIDNTSDRLKCLELILEEKNVNVRCADNKNNTPLHYVARAGCWKAVTLLLNKGSYIGHMNNFNVPPIADIPAGILSQYFDDCLHTRKERTNEYILEFNYLCLKPHVSAEHTKTHQDIREMEVLQYIANDNTLKQLLKHPLISSFLYLKWYRIWPFLFMKFLLYVMFYLLLNIYILSTNYNNSKNMNETQNMNSSEIFSNNTLEIVSYHANMPLMIFIIITLIFFMFKEILQFISYPRNYVSKFENWLQITLIILAFVMLAGAGSQVCAVIILLSSWKLMTLISQHPYMFCDAQMFQKVSLNFLRLLFPSIFMILAFAIAFYILFKDSGVDSFSNPGYSFFKTIIMLTGEFDTNDIPFISYPVWSRFIFVLFVFLIAIVLFNLLNGLAVSDTTKILNDAELVGFISRINLIAYIENLAVGAPFRHLSYYNISRWLRWNPFAFLAKRILLFPDLLDEKICIKFHDNLDICDSDVHKEQVHNEPFNRDKHWATLKMDPSVIKQAKLIISHKNQLSDYEKIMIMLNKLQDKLIKIENRLKTVK